MFVIPTVEAFVGRASILPKMLVMLLPLAACESGGSGGGSAGSQGSAGSSSSDTGVNTSSPPASSSEGGAGPASGTTAGDSTTSVGQTTIDGSTGVSTNASTGEGPAEGSSSSGAGGLPANFATVEDVVLLYGCTSSCCHGGENPPHLSDRENLYTTLTTHVAEECSTYPLVVPGDPENSALLQILSGPCGTIPRMPNSCQGLGCVSEAEMAAIEEWIANGAPM